ncbi:cation:proton antiporter [Paludibaculum fermentans]|uniref:cation:proton antiporter n=1 Tax=Paludibaculum fermentans TaxID=1473598 RepID=UPI003EB99F87
MNTPSALSTGTAEAVHLPLQMLIVFGSAKLLAELAERLRMPGIVGGLLAGILIGPSALGWIQYDGLLHALAELGVMFLLFQVGLEVKATELMRAGKTAMIVAMLGVILPFLLGWAIMLGAGHPHLESIFMGAAMVATSVGITAQVLAGKGLLKHRTAQIILAAAVIDDVLGLLVLAVVSSMGEGKGIDFLGLATTAVVSIGFVVAVAKFGTKTVNIVLPKMMEKARAQEGEFAIAVCFLFIMALLATYSGVAAIVGAFLAGMALAEIASPRLHTLVQGAGELMIPFFLASIGLQLDLRIFSSPSTLGLAVVILLAAVVSKAVGCGLGSYGLGLKDATRIGLGMVPRGEVGMVVAQVGLSKGNISQEVYGIAVFMAVMTTIVAPPLLGFAYRDLVSPDGEDDDGTRVRLG